MDEVIAKAKCGDQASREQIVENYKHLVRSVANRLFLLGADKEDLLMEGALGVIDAIDAFDEDKGSFPSYVKVCVVGRTVNAVKKASAQKNTPLANYVSLDSIAELPDRQTPLDAAIFNEFVKKLEACLTLLTPTEKKVFSLFSEGYTYVEIMQMTNKTYKAVDGALQRARKKLGDRLKEYV